jgi:hypothetical protein
MSTVVVDETHPDMRSCEGYRYCELRDVVAYAYMHAYGLDRWHAEVAATPASGEEEQARYFVVDTVFDHAFSHWVFESAVYLPLFLLLKREDASLKLLLKRRRGNKDLFLRHFGVPPEDVCYQLPGPSTVLFPAPTTSLNNGGPATKDYHEWIVRAFISACALEEAPPVRDLLVMPRQTKENCVENDRSVPLEKLQRALVAAGVPHDVLHTDETRILAEQVRRVNESARVVLVDGSAFLVNGLLCGGGRDFYVVGPLSTEALGALYARMGHLVRLLKERHRVVYCVDEEAAIKLLLAPQADA